MSIISLFKIPHKLTFIFGFSIQSDIITKKLKQNKNAIYFVTFIAGIVYPLRICLKNEWSKNKWKESLFIKYSNY